MTARPRASRLALVPACLFGLAGVASGCGERPDADGGAGPDAGRAVADSLVAPGPAAGGAADGPGADVASGLSGEADGRGTGLENFAVPEAEGNSLVADTVSLEIENPTEETVVVSARAGAAAVVLDTLPGGARLRIDLVAPRLMLEIVWETRDGARADTVRPPVVPDSVAHVFVGGPGGS